MTLEIVADAAELGRRVAEAFVDAANASEQAGRTFNVSLAGGSTPKAAFDLLAQSPYRERVDWKNVRFFFGDERCVGPEDPESNYGMARAHLFEPLGITAGAIQRIRGEDPPERAAAAYETMLREALGASPSLDLLMLGMGPDGHTASLFPGTLVQIPPQKLVAATWVEKFKTHRVTLTPLAINNARSILVSAGGAEKADALAQVLEGPRNPDLYPSQILAPAHGSLAWIVDRAAAAGLKNRPTG